MVNHLAMQGLFNCRRLGTLLHLTSLPSIKGRGAMGEAAYRFVDFLSESGQSVWQVLPITPPDQDGSPYKSLSSHAGNMALFDSFWLVEQNMLTEAQYQQHYAATDSNIHKLISIACANVFSETSEYSENYLLHKQAFQCFCSDNAHWLDDFTLYCHLSKKFNHRAWHEWPEEYAKRDSKVLSVYQQQYHNELRCIQFAQYCFFSAWLSLKHYANAKGIFLLGDMPIFVSHQSADVWANSKEFYLDELGQPITVAGVPPDYFSANGQHWGNPHYRWEVMEENQFLWWYQRFKTQLILFDALRFDHFRGLDAYWAIPAQLADARIGQWVTAPGEKLLNSLQKKLGELPLIAENLGIITEGVESLRKQFSLAGMTVLQFAFDGDARNVHLPFHHERHTLVYSGTHDNNTTVGWYQELGETEKARVNHFFHQSPLAIDKLMVNLTLSSVAKLAIIPMQDWLGLDGDSRMNFPGTLNDKNWRWRLSTDAINPELVRTVFEKARYFDRLAAV